MTIAELKRLLSAATPGPWKACVSNPGCLIKAGVYGSDGNRILTAIAPLRKVPKDSNAKLSASAVNALPLLLEIAEAAQRLQDKLKVINANPSKRAVYESAWLHGVKYDGPSYEEELKAVDAALAALPEEE